MSINTMEYAAVFMQELDSQMVECATSGWMEDNAGQVQYSGGAEVKIPKMELSGLGNYDRDKGFATGSVTVNYETKKLTQDRGRAFQVDAMDVDETNFAAERSMEMVQAYCNLEEMPAELEHVCVCMGLEIHDKGGLQEGGIKEITEGKVSVTFADEADTAGAFLQHYQEELNRFRKMQW